MLPIHVALISETTQVSFGRTAMISAALQKQVVRDFAPIWQIQATVDSFESLNDVPAGYWPILIRDDIGFNAAGIHLDKNGQPFALVDSDFDVPLTCSHELLEMLADPFGDRFVTSDSLIPEQGRVAYLVEVCDPSEGAQFGYSVNGLLLSDFYTPQYFDPVAAPSVRYSFTGAIKAPRQVLRGGYISWRTFDTGDWFQATFFSGSKISFRELGQLSKQAGRSWRETIDKQTTEPLQKQVATKLAQPMLADASFFVSSKAVNASNGWAKDLHAQIEQLIAKK